MIAVEKDRLEFEREKMRVDTVQRGKDREADMMKYELKLEADLEIQKHQLQLQKDIMSALTTGRFVSGA